MGPKWGLHTSLGATTGSERQSTAMVATYADCVPEKSGP